MSAAFAPDCASKLELIGVDSLHLTCGKMGASTLAGMSTSGGGASSGIWHMTISLLVSTGTDTTCPPGKGTLHRADLAALAQPEMGNGLALGEVGTTTVYNPM